MEVICVEEKAFYKLIDKVIGYVDEKLTKQQKAQWKWINEVEAMRLLNIKSKTTLQELRNNGKIRFSQPKKRIILYDKNSIFEYLEKNAREVF
ncbi:helix-turn-helix domain-containing protein [Flavivirga rizhaonensis]|uniref:DNA-binding protein n=1 Tax=Flavivirga rizhaonensis TaxID=2559571 RepID=A0A4S1E0H3_9FLAO|nr:helix-turn-helix domain-containing protein [Flavivirga rizhaonensis]TGV03382.1 DNA-binding protein [Flavivirga rizhaonensis]